MLLTALFGRGWPILYLLCRPVSVSQWTRLLVWTPPGFLSGEGGNWDRLYKVASDLSFTVSVVAYKKDEESMYPMGIQRRKLASCSSSSVSFVIRKATEGDYSALTHMRM